MIKEEIYGTHRTGERLIKRYSDLGVYIRKVGTDEVYAEAIDLEGMPFVYEETSSRKAEE